MSVKELFKSADEDPIVVNSISIDEALLALKTDGFGNNNYDISKEKKNASAASDSTSGFAFDIEEYDKCDQASPVDYHFFLEVFEIGEEGFAF